MQSIEQVKINLLNTNELFYFFTLFSDSMWIKTLYMFIIIILNVYLKINKKNPYLSFRTFYSFLYDSQLCLILYIHSRYINCFILLKKTVLAICFSKKHELPQDYSSLGNIGPKIILYRLFSILVGSTYITVIRYKLWYHDSRKTNIKLRIYSNQ